MTEATATPEAGTATATPGATGQTPEASEPTLLGAGEGSSPESGKAGEGQPEAAKLKAPENYEFKVPEGFTLDNEVVEAFAPLFKEADLSQEQAQKLVDAYAPIQAKRDEAARQAAIRDYENMSNEWKKESINLFGADYQKKMAPAAKLIEKTGFGNEIRGLLEETRIGNHPTMVKFLVWLGSAVSEDSFVEPKQHSTGGGLTSLYDHPTSKATLK